MSFKKAFTFFLCCMLLPGLLYSQGYNRKFKKAIKRAIGSDYKHYIFLSYPIDNFGVLTCYDTSPDDQDFAGGVNKFIKEPIQTKEQWLNLNGFVIVGGGGQIKLDSKTQTNFALQAVVPKVFQALKLSGELDSKKKITTNLYINKAYRRVYEPDRFQKFIADSMPGTKINATYNKKHLVYVCADLVIDSMFVSITIDDSLAAKIDIELAKYPNGIIQSSDTVQTVQNPNVNIGMSRVTQGTYAIVFSKPVIVARLIKYQPLEGPLKNEDDHYYITTAPDPSLIP